MSNALAVVAQNIGVSAEETTDVLKGMIISVKNQHGATASNAELAIVASTCAKYSLNPLVKECSAFISGGKLQMVLMIDGWYKIVNRHPDFDGVEFEDHINDQGALTAITCRMYIKGRSRPVTVTEYLAECRDPKSSVWQKWPSRMLRHKAYIQCARMAFGISEMIDEDEARRYSQTERDVTPSQPSTPSVDWKSLEERMAECGDEATLNALCAEIRQEMDKVGAWSGANPAMCSDMKKRHRERIQSYAKQEEAEEADFTAVDDGAKQSGEDAKDDASVDKPVIEHDEDY